MSAVAIAPVALGGNAHRTVLVFRKDILPLSETFIRDQLDSFSQWRAVLAGYRLVPGLDMTGRDLALLQRNDVFDQIRLKAAQHGQYVGLFCAPLQRLVERVDPDLIHAHFGYDAILISNIAHKLGLPLVVTLHGTDILTADSVWRSGSEGWFFRRYPAKLRKLFDHPNTHFIAVSQALREAAIARGAPQDRTHMLHTGVDTQAFVPSGRPFGERRGVLFVGRLVPFKGCEYLIRAMALVQSEIADCVLTIIGDGPLRLNLQQLALDLGVKANFRGTQSRSEIREAMGHAAAFCLPSVTDDSGCFEAFGMVLLEAQASGLPVVTSARGGRDAVQHGRTGFVFAERDVPQLSQLLQTLLTEEDLWAQFSVAGRFNVEQDFALPVCTGKIEQRYDAILRAG